MLPDRAREYTAKSGTPSIRKNFIGKIRVCIGEQRRRTVRLIGYGERYALGGAFVNSEVYR